MACKVKGLGGWWMAVLLSVGSLAAAGDLRLVEAVEERDQEAVHSLLQERADVNAAQADGATALHWAAHWDDPETAELLIRAGADVNAANDYGVTPLWLACTNGSAAIAGKLLEAGANPNAALPTGETVLMMCARAGNAETVNALLVHGADVNAAETRRGQTALMRAVAQKQPEAAKTLIEHGADVHARSNGGFTPLLFAAQQGDLESARILLATGANVNEATPDGMSMLLLASASGHEALSIFLLEEGADPNAVDAYGATALHYAVMKGIASMSGVSLANYVSHLFRPSMPELVKALLAHGANPNARLVDGPRLAGRSLREAIGATPFLLAAAANDVSVMRILAENGADPLLATKGKLTPLAAAAGVGRVQDFTEAEEHNALEAVKLALESGRRRECGQRHQPDRAARRGKLGRKRNHSVPGGPGRQPGRERHVPADTLEHCLRRPPPLDSQRGRTRRSHSAGNGGFAAPVGRHPADRSGLFHSRGAGFGRVSNEPQVAAGSRCAIVGRNGSLP